MNRLMRKLARWHIWLGWLVGVPLLLWTLSGLAMVAKPIEEVHGDHLRIAAKPQALTVPGGAYGSVSGPIREIRAVMQDGRAVALMTMMDGSVRRTDMATGATIPPVDAAGAREVVGRRIVGGDRVESVRLFAADAPPLDFRKPVAAWRVALADGTYVYVGRETGEIEAVRTRWWRFYDFMWGLHIMDLQTRENLSHPILIIFATLALVGTLMGTALLFRRRKVRVRS